MNYLYGLTVFSVIILVILLPLVFSLASDGPINRPLRRTSEKAKKRIKHAEELGIIPKHFVQREATRSITGDDLIAIFHNVFRQIAFVRKPNVLFGDIISGVHRDRIVSRAECAVMIAKTARAFGLYFESSVGDYIGDIEECSEADMIAFAVEIAAMDTVGLEGNFIPYCDVTMEEAILAAERLVICAEEKYG